MTATASLVSLRCDDRHFDEHVRENVLRKLDCWQTGRLVPVCGAVIHQCRAANTLSLTQHCVNSVPRGTSWPVSHSIAAASGKWKRWPGMKVNCRPTSLLQRRELYYHSNRSRPSAARGRCVSVMRELCGNLLNVFSARLPTSPRRPSLFLRHLPGNLYLYTPA